MTSTTRSNPGDYPTVVDYDKHARNCAPDDFWGQIKRTVNGKAVPDSHIDMIIEAIRQHLAPQPRDVILDLACGNGALSQRLFDSCATVLGVDISEYLIKIANQYFAKPPSFAFIAAGAADYLQAETAPERFTKVLCYGSFSYFSQDDAQATFKLLRDRFTCVESIFVGNLPDRERADQFYAGRTPAPAELIDPRAQIGIWRTRDEFAAMANGAGWDVEFSTMPPEYYSAHYRYDALLRPQSDSVKQLRTLTGGYVK